jgi:hypothetical protein
MAGITLEQAETQLGAYLAAEAKVLTGQAYEINGRRMTRANLAEIQAGIQTWDARVKTLSSAASGRRRAVTVSPGW